MCRDVDGGWTDNLLNNKVALCRMGNEWIPKNASCSYENYVNGTSWGITEWRIERTGRMVGSRSDWGYTAWSDTVSTWDVNVEVDIEQFLFGDPQLSSISYDVVNTVSGDVRREDSGGLPGVAYFRWSDPNGQRMTYPFVWETIPTGQPIPEYCRKTAPNPPINIYDASSEAAPVSKPEDGGSVKDRRLGVTGRAERR